MLCVARGVNRMARIDRVKKKAVDVEAVFQDRLSRVAQDTEALLERLLTPGPLDGERARPKRLLEAMRYASLGGGKRLRPFLVVESAALFDVSRQNSLMAGAALECVHCYSLAHDDLPAMDNDDLRRGRPTAHKAFDEATAILAGDGLLTHAFAVIADTATHPSGTVRSALVGGLAGAAGPLGMVGGQMMDIEAETQQLDEAAIRCLQALKTGALLAFSAEAGALLAEVAPADHAALVAYGRDLGAAFQIADDVLDASGSAVKMGKAVGKDAAAGQATLVAALGLEGARAEASRLAERAQEALASFGGKADTLRAAAAFVVARQH